MRKMLIYIFAAVFIAVFLAGCQSTPQEPIVIQKDLEQMIEKAQTTPELAATSGISLREQTGAPETLKLESADGSFTLSVDANVLVPDSSSMPILNVRSAVFSQQTVDRYWNELVGDTPMWEWSDQPTKEQIEQMIVNQKRMQAATQKEGGDTEGYENIIAELERLYQKAPETGEVVSAFSQLKEKINWDPVLGTVDTHYMGTSGYSIQNQAEMQNADEWIYISVSNPWTEQEGTIKSDSSPASLRFESSAMENNYGFSGSTFVDEYTELDDSVKKHLKTTPKEAKKLVEEFLFQTDTPMAVYSIELMDDADMAEGKEAQHYAYRVTCVREVDGLPVTPSLGYGAGGMFLEGYAFNPPELTYSIQWSYESMVLELDDAGFFQINWHAPLEILDAQVEVCSLMPFDDVQDVFEKMLFISYEPNVEEGYSMTCDISKVRLELMRIRKQNSDQVILEGLLIPVWTFYGTCYIYNSSGEFVDGAVRKTNILSINAIDGSIIDPHKGY